MKSFFKILFELGKVRISLPVALSALAGFVLYSGELNSQAWLMALGVFFISCASGALNHWQERNTDIRMPRTRNRPIAAGKISATAGFLIVMGYLVAGSIVLFLSNPMISLILSWITLIFYNFVYTPLKKMTAFAVIPGSMVGALPPVIGWTAAGGSIFAEPVLIVALFFFIGQIPHFWLLLLIFGDQYKLAGLPSLTDIFSEFQIKRITYVWVLTTIASALLVLFLVMDNLIIILLILFYIIYLLVTVTVAVFGKKPFKVMPAFYRLNFLYLFMMLFLIADSLLS